MEHFPAEAMPGPRGMGILSPGAWDWAGYLVLAGVAALVWLSAYLRGPADPSVSRPTTETDVLCEAAVRDEGVSHHYLPAGRLATAPAEMTAVLGAALRESALAFRTGVSWTIDTPYRETVAEARHYQAAVAALLAVPES